MSVRTNIPQFIRRARQRLVRQFGGGAQKQRADKRFLDSWNKVADAWPASRFLPTSDLQLSQREKGRLPSGIHDWRVLVPRYLDRFSRLAPSNGAIYCFGVAHGETVTGLVRGFRDLGLSVPHMHLFDSFEGLPDEEGGVSAPSIWHPGAFARPRYVLEDTLRDLGLTHTDFTIHDGWFCDTLTEDGVRDGSLPPALYVDIDADLYSSTMDALSFLSNHGLITVGTMIGYDDWGDTDLWVAGESRAHKEIVEKHNFACAQVLSWGERPLIRKLFLVVAD